jgi:hypothetical protein
LDHTFVSDRVPQPFVQLVKYFYPQAKTIEEYWKMAQIAAYRNNHEKETGQVLETAIHSFKQLINKIKSTKIVKKPISYFYGILDGNLTSSFGWNCMRQGFAKPLVDMLPSFNHYLGVPKDSYCLIQENSLVQTRTSILDGARVVPQG